MVMYFLGRSGIDKAAPVFVTGCDVIFVNPFFVARHLYLKVFDFGKKRSISKYGICCRF